MTSSRGNFNIFHFYSSILHLPCSMARNIVNVTFLLSVSRFLFYFIHSTHNTHSLKPESFDVFSSFIHLSVYLFIWMIFQYKITLHHSAAINATLWNIQHIYRILSARYKRSRYTYCLCKWYGIPFFQKLLRLLATERQKEINRKI